MILANNFSIYLQQLKCSNKLVELDGIEPTTSTLPALRSPS